MVVKCETLRISKKETFLFVIMIIIQTISKEFENLCEKDLNFPSRESQPLLTSSNQKHLNKRGRGVYFTKSMCYLMYKEAQIYLIFKH